MRSCSKRLDRGLTLLEVLIALALLLVVLAVLMQFMTNVDRGWKSAAADPFAEAQDAFETLSHNLALATLEPYQDYADSTGAFRTNSTFIPDHLTRRSDLAFVCGPSSGTNGLLASSGRIATGSSIFFLAPQGYTQTYAHTGTARLLNAMGYFVEFGDDDSAPAFILPLTHEWRWRLKQVQQPAESLQIFSTTTSSAWIQQMVPTGASPSILAENIITLIVLPERAANDSASALAPVFSYDSRDKNNALTLHQLPPRLRLVLVAMDDTSARRLATVNGSNAPALVPPNLFQQASLLDNDLASLDNSLTAQKIEHRILQREILLPGSTWSNAPSQ
jgi:uncharacterized protein (TIGR02599 family)